MEPLETTEAPADAPGALAADASPDVRAIIAELAPLMARQRQHWAWRCHAHGLSITQLQVITALEADGPLPMSRVAELLDVGVSSATGIIGRMEERGIVERIHDAADRRVVLARLTVSGRQLIGEIEAGRLVHLRGLLEMMSRQEQANLLAAVRSVVAVQRALSSDLQRSDHS